MIRTINTIKKISLIACFLLLGAFGFGQALEADVMPYFRGCASVENEAAKRQCSNEKLVKYLQAAIEYPETARKDRVEGTVFLSFVVNALGKVETIEVLRGIGGGCDETATSIVNEMPNWEPASKAGEPVAVKMNLPIQFSLGLEDGSQELQYRIIWSNLSDRENLSSEEVMNAIDQPIALLDLDGNKVQFNDLTFIRTKGKKFKSESSAGNITKSMRKLAKRLKKGNNFSIIATIQVDGSFSYIEKEWLIE